MARFTSTATILRSIMLPSMVWAFLLPATLSGWLENGAASFAYLEYAVPTLYAAAIIAGYWLAAIGGEAKHLYRANFGSWLIATLFSAALIWLGLRAAKSLQDVPDMAEALAVAGPLWLILANVLQVTVHVALRKEVMLGDLDREWLARLSAVKLRAAVAWTVFAFCCLSLQRLAFMVPGSALPYWAVPVVTFTSGPIAAWLGQQAMSRLQSDLAGPGAINRILRWGLPLLGVVFAAGLLTLLGYLLGQALGFVQIRLAVYVLHISPTDPVVTLPVQLAVAVLLAAVLFELVRRINVNRFSMHGVYRNRLTRAFLGAVRRNRTPDPFTGFDPEDNPRMVELRPREGPWRLFHVVNVALNLTATTRTAWAERKAAAFTITPLASGAADLWLPRTSPHDPGGCYVESGAYAGTENETGRRDEAKGISLASAITISGAAVSPNWGYHSSPITAFLMTLFNVRLGAWLPNPSVVTDPRELALAWPHQALLPMLDDLLGRTTDMTKAIYLSDGGHFDNLGLYEMLRRRCRLILVVDAGEDYDCAFEDLGAAIRKSAIDQGILVTFTPRIRICSRGKPMPDAIEFAVGNIVYPESAELGTLLYIKPCFLDDVPADVRAYGAAHDRFPHEPTSDQWFSESQFESYRALGDHQMSKLCGLANEDTLADLFQQARAEVARRPVAV